MEFSEKLQELRKGKGLTQEELAAALYVSRTAVSKWESGRGYPSIDSLKEIAKFFSVSIDALLSGDEALNFAEEESKQRTAHMLDLVYGLLDLGAATFFFLPLFGQKLEGAVQSGTLLSLTGIAPYLKAVYFVCVIGTILWGILTLTLQNCTGAFWLRWKRKLSWLLSTGSLLVFIISSQVYGALLVFFFLAVKAVLAMTRSVS